jgi:Ca-activated chloride channel family protein
MDLYEAGTNNLKYTFVHTINRYGNPDTLILDPSIKYDLVVHTLPKITKSNISIIKHMHNTINVDAPQGYLKFTAPKSSSQNGVLMRVMEKDKSQTINTQVFNSKDKYLIGIYDVEIFTLPRIIKRIEITQGQLSTIDVEAAGSLEFIFPKPMIGQLLLDKANGRREWVCNLDESSLKGKLSLQPGNYVLVYRDKGQKSTAYTKEKKFKIESNKIVLLNL